jgi:hypothetical protein
MALGMLTITPSLAGACASATPKTWEDFGVDSSVVTALDSIADEEALRFVRKNASTATEPRFAVHERTKASAWFRLDPPLRGRDSAYARFDRTDAGWTVEDIETGIGHVLVDDSIDIAVARRLLDWVQVSREADSGDLTRVKVGDNGAYDLVFSYDGRQKTAEGCICVSWLPVHILADGDIEADEMQEGGCFLFGPTG